VKSAKKKKSKGKKHMAYEDISAKRLMATMEKIIEDREEYIQELSKLSIQEPEFPASVREGLQQAFTDLPLIANVQTGIEKDLDMFLARIDAVKREKRFPQMQSRLEQELSSLRESTGNSLQEIRDQQESLPGLIRSGQTFLKRAGSIIDKNAKTVTEASERLFSSGKDFEDRISQLSRQLSVFNSSVGAEGADRVRLIQGEAEVFLDGLGERNSVYRGQLRDYEEKIMKLQAGKASNDSRSASIDDLQNRAERQVASVADIVEDEQAGRGAICAPEGTITIEDRPCVKIFYLQPPAPVDLLRFSDYRQVQNYVSVSFDLFRWNLAQNPTGFDCVGPGQESNVNACQALSYHYMNPNQPDLNTILYHSAGSGKTVTLMLMASVFARAGYMPVIVTKKSLMNNYLEAAFEQNADVNVLQYLHFKSVRSIRELLQRELGVDNVTRDQVWSRGEEIYKEMGIPWSRENQIMTFAVLSNIANNSSAGKLRHLQAFPAQKGTDGDTAHPNDPMAMKIVLIDEVQKLTAISTDITATASGDIMALQELFWRSRELSGQEAVRVVCATATPNVDSPIDGVMIANLLVDRDSAVDLRPAGFVAPRPKKVSGGGAQISVWQQVKPVLEQNFLSKFTDSATGSIIRQRPLEKLLMGRISYLNLVGDKSHFAVRKKVNWVEVYLSAAQEEDIADCAKKHANLKFNPTTGEWKALGPPMSPANFRECVMKNVNFPENKRSKEGKKLSKKNSTALREISLRKATGGLKRRAFARNSPVIESVIDQIDKDYLESTRIMRSLGNLQGNQGRALKQMVFSDLGKNQSSDLFGVDLVAALLRGTLDYESITEIVNGAIRMKTPEQLSKIPPYKGILVLNKDLLSKGESTSPAAPGERNDAPARAKRLQRELLSYFNSQENTDGRNVSIVLVDGNYKEGISLSDIGYVQVLGYVDNRADLIQAVARAFRNCRSTNLPWEPGKGARVQVNMFSPTFSPSSKYRKGRWSIRELVQKVSGAGVQKTIEDMNNIFRNVAYDRALMDTINSASKQEEDKITIENPNK